MNVLVVVLDTVRPDSLGSTGAHPLSPTPAMDRLAAQGAILDAAYAEYPITVPTRTAFVSGIFTWTNRPWSPLRPYDLHVAEIFRDTGYATAAFSDSPFSEPYSFDRGFDLFAQYPRKLQPPSEMPEHVDLRNAYFPPGHEDEELLWRNACAGWLDEFPRKYGRVGMELLVDSAIRWLDERDARKPFFLWLDTFQPHEPWIPPAPYDAMYQPPGYTGRFLPMPVGPSSDWMTPVELQHVVGLYLGELALTDLHLGRLVDHVDASGLGDDTLIVVLSDHGQPFGDHGTIRKYGVPLYEEHARIVWLMRKPGLIDAGSRVGALACSCDLLPTLTDLCGIDLPDSPELWRGDFTGLHAASPRGVDGVSLGPVLRGEAAAARESAWLGAFGLRAGVRQGSWKFIDNRGEKPNELYDLASDPTERRNLAPAEPDRAARMHRELWEFAMRWSATLAWRDAPAAGHR